MSMAKAFVVFTGIGLMTCTAISGEMQPQISVQGRSGIKVSQQPVDSTPTIALSKQGEGVGKQQVRAQKDKEVKYYNLGRAMMNPSLRTPRQSDSQSDQ